MCHSKALRRASSGEAATLAFEPFPALELLHQQPLDLLRPRLVLADLLRALLVVIRFAHASGELPLLLLESLDFARQRLELSLLLVAELRSCLLACGRRWFVLGWL